MSMKDASGASAKHFFGGDLVGWLLSSNYCVPAAVVGIMCLPRLLGGGLAAHKDIRPWEMS